jgi:outer membrane biosynthesis protein TonB
VRDLGTRLRTNPVVTVAARSDGSVESMTFELSSGAADVDEAIRRVVRNNEHYRLFPPELARDYDVI